MNHLNQPFDETIVDVRMARGTSPVVLVCEHASAHIPDVFEALGVTGQARHSHVAWDLGALAVAEGMAARLDATLIAAKTSRLVYDCNRPPDAPDAMPARSEVVQVPGNESLSAAQQAQRVATYYTPFRDAVAQVMGTIDAPVLITVHSFTPVYKGVPRDVEIGILHDNDVRFADALLTQADSDHVVRRNEPYGPTDGVTHTLKEHALPQGHLNVMLEVRNDLIADSAAQNAMAELLCGWIEGALVETGRGPC